MPKIPRVTQKIFASAAANNGVIGSGQDGTKILTQDLAALMAKPAYLNGWLDMILGASKFPPLEEFQALEYIANTQIAYLFQEGIAEYDAASEYYIGSIVKKTNTFQLYGSLTNGNTGHALTDAANWQFLTDLGNTRKDLSANTTYYVATTGNDVTGTGAAGAPWQTLQRAINYVLNSVNLNGFNVTIQLAAGTYTAGCIINNSLVGAGSLSILGDTVTPGNCIISTTNSSCIVVTSGQNINIGGFRFLTAGSGNGLVTTTSGVINLTGKCEFGAMAAGGFHMSAGDGGVINTSGNYSIIGGAAAHMIANSGQINITSPAITLTGTPAFSSAFAIATNSGGALACNSATTTFTGTATGARYTANVNGTINTIGSGTTFFPGNAVGTTASGGQYV